MSHYSPERKEAVLRKLGSSEEFVGKNTVDSTQLNPIYSYRACEPSYPSLRLA